MEAAGSSETLVLSGFTSQKTAALKEFLQEMSNCQVLKSERVDFP
jgi:hypothetical protein